MKTAQEIIIENQNTHIPNVSIKALAKAAYDDMEGFCIMDDEGYLLHSYREECPDRCSCWRPDYMLACIATRDIHDKKQLGEKAIRIYNQAEV